MAKTKSVHDDYEIPDELDFSKLETIGFGLDSLKQFDAKKAEDEIARRTIELAPDVAAAFKTADEVNDALRTILRVAQRLQESPKTEPVAKAS